jgi:hypothetical protein
MGTCLRSPRMMLAAVAHFREFSRECGVCVCSTRCSCRTDFKAAQCK